MSDSFAEALRDNKNFSLEDQLKIHLTVNHYPPAPIYWLGATAIGNGCSLMCEGWLKHRSTGAPTPNKQFNKGGKINMDIKVTLKDGSIQRFDHVGRPGGNATKKIRYEKAFAVITDEWYRETAIPVENIKEIKTFPGR